MAIKLDEAKIRHLNTNGTTTIAGGHIYLTGAQAGSSTGNTTQIVFGTANDNHVALSSNSNAFIINPTTSGTTNQIVLYLNQKSKFPSGIDAGTGGITTAGAISATGNISGNYIQGTWLYTSAATALTTASKIAVIHSDNYIYYITPADLTTLIKNNASGTWGISISGNAATATKLGKSAFTVDTIDNVTHNGLLYGTISSYTDAGFSSNDAMILSMAWNTGNSYGAQIALDDTTTPNMYVRNKNSSWSVWSKVLLSTNYTDYTVKKDGTGASGTWGISITGNAATATKATQDGSGNTITSKYVTVDTAQTIGGAKTFSKTITLSTQNYLTVSDRAYILTKYSDFQYSSLTPGNTSGNEEFMKAALKAMCTKYPGFNQPILLGNLGPNSQGPMYGSIYNTSTVDSTTGLPQYSTFWFSNLNGNLNIFGTSSYNYYCKTVLDSSNYTSYTVTKTGSGASGNNWAIGITGNAATATTASKTQAALSLNGKSFNGSVAVDMGTLGVAYGGTGRTSLVTPTVTWTNGSTAGPTLTIKDSLNKSSTAVAIPAASNTISGIITTGTQTIIGEKTIDGIVLKTHRFMNDLTPTAGWYRIAKLDYYQGYFNLLLFFHGGYNHGRPSTAVVHVSGEHSTPSLKQIAGDADSFYTKVRLVGSSSTYYLEIYSNATGGSIGSQYVSFLGVGTISAVYTPTTPDGATSTNNAEISLKTMKDTVTFAVADNSATNTGAAVTYDSSSNITLKLPSTIKATLNGNASSSTKTGDGGVYLYAHNSNEINFGGSNASTTMYFGYRAMDSRSIPTKFIFGGASGSADLQVKTIYLGSGTTSYISSTQYTGNAATATKLATPRSLKISGTPGTTGTNFDGSADATLIIPTTVKTFTELGTNKISSTAALYITPASTLYLDSAASTSILFRPQGTEKARFDTSGNFLIKTAMYPGTNNTYNLGTSSYKWANVYATTFNGALNGNATTASALTDITTTDAASSSSVWRRIWMCWSDNTHGRPAYDDRFAIQTSTGTLKAPIFLGDLTGNASTASSSPKLTTSGSLTSSTIDSFLEAGVVKWGTGDSTAVGSNDGIVVSFGWSSSYGAQMWLDDGSGEGGMKIRNRNGGTTWNPWRQVLTENNYSNYAAPASHTHAWSAITGKPSTFTPSSHSHAWGDITGKPSTFTPSNHEHSYITYTDTRAEDQTPDATRAGLTIHLKSNSTDGLSNGGTYHAVLNVKDWGDYSGGPYWQASVTANDNMYYRRSTSGSAWGAWRKVWAQGDSVTGAVWNDYAEYRESDCQEFGRVLSEKGDDTLTKTTERLQPFAGVSSDTWGFCQGETEKAKTPIAVAGRVLVYTYRDRKEYKPGDVVCAAPNGTVDIMTREEIITYPDRIVGTVSCVPEYETWGSGDRDPVKVNNRIWIKVN